jgi:hypothetical protein
MKRVMVVLLQFILLKANAQTGDFQLENLPQRAYIKISANPGLKGNGFKRWLIGENYRQEWTDSIRVPVLDLKSDFGGLTPEKEGGGKQTRSLHLKDGRGRNWVLRSVEKFPEKVLAPELKGTIAENLVHDGISASYPYSVLSVGTLAKATGTPYFQNTVVYIPDDPALGEFRSKYANTLSLLEFKTIGDKEIHDTEDIVPELYKDNKKAIDQKAVLRARLLDNFIMDFDRHEGQWEWAEKDSAGRTFYYPIPKDRDQAFFKADGLLPKKLSHRSTLGQLQGLSIKAKDIRTFNYAARNFDRAFLSEPDEATWSNEIDAFLSSMTEDVISSALSRQPKGIQKYHSGKIAEVLKNKKAFFKEDMMEYYRFLSKIVSVVGSNESEVFSITKSTDGSVQVTAQDKDDSTVTYQRLFDTATQEIRIYGLEGDDLFLISGESSPIKIRLIGGPGEDVFTNNAKEGKVFVYDVSFERNSLEGKFKNKISKDPLNNEYQRINPIYSSSSVGPMVEYARDGGLFLGLRYTATTTGFRKEPYAGKHVFFVTKALSSSAWHLHYDADIMKVGRNTDILFRSDAKLPTVRTRFFGYGNNTVFSESRDAGDYLVQYPLVDASLMLRHSLSSWLQLQYGPLLQYFNISEAKNKNRYLTNLPPYEIEASTYGPNFFGGAEARLTINTKNDEVIPTRGLYVNAYTRSMMKFGGTSKEFNQSGGSLSFYTDFLLKDHIVIASSFGLNHNFGNFEIPQAQYLGFRQNLRGYRYQRFAGRTRAYNNTELRIKFSDVNFYLFKGPLGVTGFHDVGRVWSDGESSKTWHKGYGGGIWLAPFNKVVVSGLLTFSEEESALPFVTFGFYF